MTSPLPRPLTPLERAILRAVVELGDEAYPCAILLRTGEILGKPPDFPHLYVCLGNLERRGYLHSEAREFDSRGRTYWRPAYDLTEVLKEP